MCVLSWTSNTDRCGTDSGVTAFSIATSGAVDEAISRGTLNAADALSTESGSHKLAVALHIDRPVEFFFCDDLMWIVQRKVKRGAGNLTESPLSECSISQA